MCSFHAHAQKLWRLLNRFFLGGSNRPQKSAKSHSYLNTITHLDQALATLPVVVRLYHALKTQFGLAATTWRFDPSLKSLHIKVIITVLVGSTAEVKHERVLSPAMAGGASARLAAVYEGDMLVNGVTCEVAAPRRLFFVEAPQTEGAPASTMVRRHNTRSAHILGIMHNTFIMILKRLIETLAASLNSELDIADGVDHELALECVHCFLSSIG